MRRRSRRINGHDMTCSEAVALVTAYLDDALSLDSRRLFEAHLDECDMCAEHVKQIRVTVAVAGRVRREDLDPNALADLMRLYRRWRDDPANG